MVESNFDLHGMGVDGFFGIGKYGTGIDCTVSRREFLTAVIINMFDIIFI